MTDIRKFNYNGNIVTVEFEGGQKMVNVTEMAKPFDKRPADFLRNKGTQEFILALRHREKTKSISDNNHIFRQNSSPNIVA